MEKNITPDSVISALMNHAKTSDSDFSVHVFPAKMQRIILELNTTCGFPIGYTASAMIAAISVAIGNTDRVEVKLSGCVEYALALKEKNKEARLLYAEGLLTDTPKDIIDVFECQRHLNSRVQHWCGLISLSYSPKDAERMSDEFMVKIALEYMDKMGIKNTQFIIVRHLDSSTKSLCSAKNEHPHCHIVYNRVDNGGKCVSDSFEYYRNNEICDEMKKKYGLTYGENKDNVKTQNSRK